MEFQGLVALTWAHLLKLGAIFDHTIKTLTREISELLPWGKKFSLKIFSRIKGWKTDSDNNLNIHENKFRERQILIYFAEEIFVNRRNLIDFTEFLPLRYMLQRKREKTKTGTMKFYNDYYQRRRHLVKQLKTIKGSMYQVSTKHSLNKHKFSTNILWNNIVRIVFQWNQ